MPNRDPTGDNTLLSSSVETLQAFEHLFDRSVSACRTSSWALGGRPRESARAARPSRGTVKPTRLGGEPRRPGLAVPSHQDRRARGRERALHPVHRIRQLQRARTRNASYRRAYANPRKGYSARLRCESACSSVKRSSGMWSGTTGMTLRRSGISD